MQLTFLPKCYTLLSGHPPKGIGNDLDYLTNHIKS